MRLRLLAILLALSAATRLIAVAADTTEFHDYSLSNYQLPILSETYPAIVGLLVRAPGATFAHPPSLPGKEPLGIDEVANFIQKMILPSEGKNEGTGIEYHGENTILVAASHEMQAGVVQALTALGSLNRPCSVHVDFGTIPVGEPCPTGIIPAAESQRLCERLRAHSTLSASGCVDHLISARSGSEQPFTAAARISDGHLLPITAMLRRGKAVAATMGSTDQTTYLTLQLSWVEDAAPLGTSMIRCPEHPASNAPVPAGSPPEKEVARMVPGEQFAIDLPALWTWRPACDCALREGQVLALCCEHGGELAVMLVSVECSAKSVQPRKLNGPAGLTTCFYDVSHCLRSLSEYPGWEAAPHEGPVDLLNGDGEKAPLPDIAPEVDARISEVIELIQKQVDPNSWKADGVGMGVIGGALYVIQTEAVHAQIPRVIAALSRERQRQTVVRWHRLPAPLPGNAMNYDERQWAAMGRQPVSVVMVIREGDSGYHFGGVQRNYLASDQLVHGLHRPFVATFSSGTVLELLPSIGADGVKVRVHATLIAEPTWSTMGLIDEHGLPLFTLGHPIAHYDETTEERIIPKGGAALMLLGESEFAITAEVIDPERNPTRADP